MKDNPEQIAADIVKTLQIHPASYKTDNPIKEWIDASEQWVFLSHVQVLSIPG